MVRLSRLGRLRKIADENGLLPAYAFPGGYPILYLVDSDVVCPDCANKLVLEEDDKKFRPSGWFIHEEGGPEICGCGEEIESAYGDPDEDEADEDDQ